ncbi:MAG TPA: sigma factor [Ilumatobacteraceae bacterium]|nr:sigma factor [Ilumatobacteraceae bacterium]
MGGSHAWTDVSSVPRYFVDVYNDRYRVLVEIARLTTGSNALAEEIVQDAFVDLYRRFDTLHSPEAYVHRATNPQASTSPGTTTA